MKNYKKIIEDMERLTLARRALEQAKLTYEATVSDLNRIYTVVDFNEERLYSELKNRLVDSVKKETV